MDDRSNKADERNAGFIGLRCDPDTKERARRRAEQEGVSLSEYVRRQLDHLDDAVEREAATP